MTVLTPAQRDEYIAEVARTGSVAQARATLRTRYAYRNPAWWRKNRVEIQAEWDRIDGEERK